MKINRKKNANPSANQHLGQLIHEHGQHEEFQSIAGKTATRWQKKQDSKQQGGSQMDETISNIENKVKAKSKKASMTLKEAMLAGLNDQKTEEKLSESIAGSELALQSRLKWKMKRDRRLTTF